MNEPWGRKPKPLPPLPERETPAKKPGRIFKFFVWFAISLLAMLTILVIGSIGWITMDVLYG